MDEGNGKYIALVGSRDTPRDILEIFIRLGKFITDKGYRLSSGDAYGVDRAAYYGSKLSSNYANALPRIFIIEDGFLGRKADNEVFIDMTKHRELEEEFIKLVEDARGSLKGLKDKGLRLHSRNVPQIAGLGLVAHNLTDKTVKVWRDVVEAIYFYAPTVKNPDKVRGGTNTAYQLAKKFKVPNIYNLYLEEDRKLVLDMLEGVEISKDINWEEIVNPDNLYTPLTEGKDHININSKSRTELGLLLSNFSYTPFNYPEYGNFRTMENFYAWLVTEPRLEHLRTCHPAEARKVIKDSTRDMDKLIPILKQALRCKLLATPKIKELLLVNNLPFKHYFYYGNDLSNVKIIPYKGVNWLVEGWEELNKELLETN